MFGVALFAKERLYCSALVEQILAVLEEWADVEWHPLLIYLVNVAFLEVDRGQVCHALLAFEFTQWWQLSLSSGPQPPERIRTDLRFLLLSELVHFVETVVVEIIFFNLSLV